MASPHFPTPPTRRRPHRVRAAAALTAALASVLLVAGCGDDDDDSESRSSPSAPSNQSPGGSASGSPSGGQNMTEDQLERRALIPAVKVTWLSATRTAMEKVSGSRLTGTELDRGTVNGKTGAAVWQSKLVTADGTEHDVDVDAVSGKVVRDRTESDQDADDRTETKSLLAKAELSPQRAAKIAEGKTRGTVSAVGLDDGDSGPVVWSVDIVTTDDWDKTTYDIDAANGNVVRRHVDRD